MGLELTTSVSVHDPTVLAVKTVNGYPRASRALPVDHPASTPYDPARVSGPKTKRVKVNVLGETYSVRTLQTRSAERRVIEAARILSERMETIGAATKELSAARLSVMAGLDLACELLVEKEIRECERVDDAAFRDALRNRSSRLLALVENELSERSSAQSTSSDGG